MSEVALVTDEIQPPLVTLRAQLEARAEEFRNVLPSHIKPETFQRTILTAVQHSPDLLACDRRSFLNACMRAAQDHLLPDGKQAALVRYNTRVKDPERGWISIPLVQYLPMTAGLIQKILQSGEIRSLRAKVVYRQELEAGCFIYEEGSNVVLRHKPILDPDFRPTDDDIALAYSVATFVTGEQSYEVMRRWEIDEIRECSQAGATLDRKGEPREAKGPWVDWFAEMAKKSVVRRHAKTLPQSGDLELVDVEAADIDRAARSAVALLDSAPPMPERTALDWRHDGPAKPAGDGSREPEPDNGPPRDEPPTQPEAPEDKPAPPEPPPAEPQAEPEAGGPAYRPRDTDDAGQPVVEPPDLDADAQARAVDELDELGVTAEPAAILAEKIIRKARSCEFLLDLKKLEKDCEFDLATMPPSYVAAVDEALEAARYRLDPDARAAADA